MTGAAHILAATQANFAQLVLDNSDKGLVLVDFWAPWVGPSLRQRDMLVELAEAYRDSTAKNLSRLVKIKSLSREEKEVQQELKRQLEAAGCDEVKIDGLGNVIGRIGTGKKVLAIDAHMDTVDVGNPDNWEFDPFLGEIRDGHVLGRGSVDQKGGAAGFVTAAKILKEIG